MSTYGRETKKCAICGNQVEVPILTSTNEFGSKDLDLRPARMRRFTMDTWIHHCPRCRFSAHALDENDGVDLTFINSFYIDNDYLIELVSGGTPNTLAEFFLQVYFRKIWQSKFDEAATQAMNAAWDCDDRENVDGAFVCRNLAIDAIEKIADPGETLLVIKADLLRRAGRFDEVLSEYANFHSESTPFVNDIIAFQINKSKVSDDGCYTLGDV